MALRNIVNKSEEVLHKNCRPVEKFDEKLGILLDDMAETMYKAKGVGLAAPQVTYIMHDLKERGLDVRTDATTVEEAADEIMRCYHD